MNVYNDTNNSGPSVIERAYPSEIERATFLVLDFTIKCTLIKGFNIGLYILNYFFPWLRYFATNLNCLTTHPNRLDKTNRTNFKLNHSDWSKN